ncbi:MAG: oligosaccharide flippase family protein [Ferruginibacter sp.]
MSEHKKSIVHNFISLSLVQGLTILFPLITFPYLLRVLGVEGFGTFTLIQTGIMYFDMLVSFGFGLTATKHISESRLDKEKTHKVISTVYIIKGILFISSVILLLLSCIFFSWLRANFLLAVISCIYLLGNLLFPDWFFQGIQKMRNITIVAFVSKLASLLLIFLLVKEKSDLIYVIVALAAGNLIAGFLGVYILSTYVSLKLKFPGKAFIIAMTKESAYVFTSIILAPFYSSVNIFILQGFTNPLIVGQYAVAEKIFNAVGMLTNIANRTFYPHLSQLYATSIITYLKNVRRIVFLFALCFFGLALIQFFCADFIVHLVTGKTAKEDIGYAADILRIMSIALLFSPYASFFFQLLVIQGQKKASIRNISAIVVINLVSACTLTYLYSGIGLAVNVCIIVFSMGLFNFISFNKKHGMAITGVLKS